MALSRYGSRADPAVIAAAAAAAMNRTPAGNTVPASEAPAVSKITQDQLFSITISDTVYELPPNVVKALEGGLKTYVPLSFCTHKACRTASRTVDAFDSEISLNDKGEFKLKQKSMNPAQDIHLTTDEFSQARENLVSGMRKHLKLGDETESGSESAHACADMFAKFFACIAARPDWTEDWSTYRGFLIDSYLAWTARRNDMYGIAFTSEAYEKYKLKSLTPNIIEIVRQQMSNASGSNNNMSNTNNTGKGRGSGNQRSRGRGRGRGNGPSGQSFRDSPQDPKCYLCGGPHLHGDHQGKAKRLVSKNGKWLDEALGDKTVCINYNVSPNGCTRTNCYFSHTCSLCGSLNHGSARCDT
jgi:hypothetical protein